MASMASYFANSLVTKSLNKRSIANVITHQKMFSTDVLFQDITSLNAGFSYSTLPDTSFITSAIDAWSVNGANLNSADIASSLFAISLFPYLAMLFFLQKGKTPPTSFFGFCFLLAFVAATIPAGIYAKYQYHDILANVDWLHGAAESLLTVTNLLIITGFRKTRFNIPTNGDSNNSNNSNSSDGKSNTVNSKSSSLSLQDIGPFLLLLPIILSSFTLTPHTEPINALSLPTWIVHSSSILEWLVAMSLIWDHAVTSDNPRWRGMAVAMIPSHASGLCACTFHLFFNNPSLNWIVALQAGLTTIGNTCMAAGAYRVWDYEKNRSSSPTSSGTSESISDVLKDASIVTTVTVAGADISNTITPSSPSSTTTASSLQLPPPLPLPESNVSFGIQLLLKSIAVAVLVKYGEIYFDFPFAANDGTAASVILLPLLYNIMQYAYRSYKISNGDSSGNSSSNNNSNSGSINPI